MVNALKSFKTSYPEEIYFIPKFISLLQQDHCFHRDHLPGHITGSSWIIDPSGSNCLMIHHAKLNRWLQPGGHADGDENIFQVAYREAIEETGIENITPSGPGLFDIDIHSIPQRNGFPEHLHFDVRFLFTASITSKLTISDESHDLAWISLKDLPDLTKSNSSIQRMAEKTLTLYSARNY